MFNIQGKVIFQTRKKKKELDVNQSLLNILLLQEFFKI